MRGNQPDREKQRNWETTIREAARSGYSIREFCRRRRLKESRFHWWQRKLKAVWEPSQGKAGESGQASFALVSDGPRVVDAGIELVLGNERRLRIGKGVDEQTLRALLAAA